MNLQHERLLALCATLNLPFIAQGYAVASQEATEKEAAYSMSLIHIWSTTRFPRFPGASAGRSGGDADFAMGNRARLIYQTPGRASANGGITIMWRTIVAPILSNLVRIVAALVRASSVPCRAIARRRCMRV